MPRDSLVGSSKRWVREGGQSPPSPIGETVPYALKNPRPQGGILTNGKCSISISG